MDSYHYTAYGLKIQSSLQCPQLSPLKTPEQVEDADVYIRYGNVPDSLESPKVEGVLYQAAPGKFLLQLDGIARYLVSEGREITIERPPGCLEDEVRLFLFDSPLGALLHQRGFLVLHGSAIQTSKGAIIFSCISGLGKSTLAAAFYQRGYGFLADEICAVAPGKTGRLLVYPAFPQINLWAEAGEFLKIDLRSLGKVRPPIKKYSLPVQDEFVCHPSPLQAIYFLRTHNTRDFIIEELSGKDKFEGLMKSTYRPSLVDGLGVKHNHFNLVSQTARQVKFCTIARPQEPNHLHEFIDLLEKDFN